MTAAADCAACTLAQHEPGTGMYRAGCPECSARMLAHAPEFFDAMSVAAFTPAYATALKRVFGADWMRGHERVRDWSRRIESQRRARAMQGAADAA